MLDGVDECLPPLPRPPEPKRAQRGPGRRLKPEKLAALMAALESGLSVRAAARAAGVNKITARRFAAGLLFTCPCGRDSRHRGWCSWRFAQSPARQAVVGRFHAPGIPESLDDRICALVGRLDLRAVFAAMEADPRAWKIRPSAPQHLPRLLEVAQRHLVEWCGTLLSYAHGMEQDGVVSKWVVGARRYGGRLAVSIKPSRSGSAPVAAAVEGALADFGAKHSRTKKEVLFGLAPGTESLIRIEREELADLLRWKASAAPLFSSRRFCRIGKLAE